ncbi:MAG: YitT family protein [Candidatus Faecousia sp.]|nr:YitT family protein [Candidatus Faecousia sp.]
MRNLKRVWTYLAIAAVAMLAALNYELFVFPNAFAPSGLNGICTMIQYVSGVSVGYLSLLINIPLALIVYFKVSKPIAVRSMVYVIVFSVGLLILDKVDLTPFAYSTANGTSHILGPLTAGLIMGYIYAILMKASAYTGGTDFVAAIIHAKNPEKSVYGLSFLMNALVAVSSYFVYDFKMEPVLLCILYSFASTNVAERFLKNGRSAVRFEIITNYPEQISKEIINKLHHTATVFPAKGMYKGKEVDIVMCVVNNSQMAALSQIVQRYPHTFAIMSQVNEVMGNFRHYSKQGQEVVPVLDQGDGKTV